MGSKVSAETGCRPGYARKTVHMNKEQFEKLKALAYWERRDLMDVVEEAVTDYLVKYKISFAKMFQSADKIRGKK
jgi:hypothetical protein